MSYVTAINSKSIYWQRIVRMQFGVETKTRLRAANGSNKRPTATNDSMYHVYYIIFI